MSPFSNRLLLLGTAVAVSLHALALVLSPTQAVLRVEALGLDDWLLIALVASSVVVVVEVHKRLRRPAPRAARSTLPGEGLAMPRGD